MGPHRSGWKIEIEELGLGIWKDPGSTRDKHSGGSHHKAMWIRLSH